MGLREELDRQGRWLFRWRSYVPLLALPLLLIALRDSECLDQYFGDTASDLYEGLCIGISLFGLTIRCITIGYVPGGTSGRNTKGQKAEILNTTGMYSVVRHPLYLGNFLITVGLTLFVQVWWFALVVILLFFLYYERIVFAEEEFLRERFGDSYLEWSDKTPAFWPRFRNWRQPSLPFSFRAVLGGESSSVFAVVASFTFLEIAGDLLVEGRLELDLAWIILFSVALVLYLVLRFLRKKTRLLRVEGR